MYLDYFSLKERPFSIAPDPRFLFMSNRYREALAHLNYGILEGGGFVLLTGEVGTGKTTVCRCLLQQLPQDTKLAFVLNPKLNSVELLATICDEFKVDYPENCTSLKILSDKLTEFLIECHRQNLNVVVMIDEAQNLETEVLEQIRLLTNLETSEKKLLQVILVGQPELQEKLAQRELRQLAQRITARYHLRPLNLKETIAYIVHRTRIAGSLKPLFSRQAVEYLHSKTKGIPRLINTICDRALLAAASRQKKRVDKPIIAEAIKEVMGDIMLTDQSGKQMSVWHHPLIKILMVTSVVAALIYSAYRYGVSRSLSNNLPPSVNAQVEKKNAAQTANAASKEAAFINSQNLVERLVGDQVWDYNGQNAFIKLFELWQLDYSPMKDGDGCDFGRQFGLFCYKTQANWQTLREINRPALAKFSAGIQGEFWGVIKSLNGVNATVVIGERETQFTIDKLSTIWTGELIAVWQAPIEYDGDIKLGDNGEDVAWLIERLNDLDQEQLPVQQVFDEKVKARLENYQRMRGLQSDGIAGMQTILRINAETLAGIPLLKTNS